MQFYRSLGRAPLHTGALGRWDVDQCEGRGGPAVAMHVGKERAARI